MVKKSSKGFILAGPEAGILTIKKLLPIENSLAKEKKVPSKSMLMHQTKMTSEGTIIGKTKEGTP